MFLPDDILLTSNIHLIVVFIISLWFLSCQFLSAGASKRTGGKSLRISVFSKKRFFITSFLISSYVSKYNL